MKVLEKVIRVNRNLLGQVSVCGSSCIEHFVSDNGMFDDREEAEAFAEDEWIGDIVREDFEANGIDIDIEDVSSDVEVSEISIDELDEYDLNMFLRQYPNYEVKEMKYEIDGVKSTKKVLVEKELEVA